jgi:hypothetical protein
LSLVANIKALTGTTEKGLLAIRTNEIYCRRAPIGLFAKNPIQQANKAGKRDSIENNAPTRCEDTANAHHRPERPTFQPVASCHALNLPGERFLPSSKHAPKSPQPSRECCASSGGFWRNVVHEMERNRGFVVSSFFAEAIR